MSDGQDKLQPLSCITCRRRKVRCDRRSPCSHCTKASIECVFPNSARGFHHHHPHDEASRQAKKKQTELLSRLRRLEGVVEDLTEQLRTRTGSDSSASATPAQQGQGGRQLSLQSTSDAGIGGESARATTSAPEDPEVAKLEQHVGQLVIDEGGTRYVGNTFWTAFRSELQNLRKDFEDADDEEGEPDLESSGNSSQPNHSTRGVSEELSPGPELFVFRSRGQAFHGEVRELHPLPSQVPFLWQTFVNNIDPLLKMVHVPTLQDKIYGVKGDYSSIPPAMEALLFAIYLTAITALEEDEVALNFGVDKPRLIARFKMGLELALARADLFNSNDVMCIQALILYLFCSYGIESTRFVWSMLGLAQRLAVAIGLHRDGARFPETVSPFDTEIRRRTWWQLCFLDSRAGVDEVTELMITDKTFDTKLPTNINDADIYPDMTEPPAPRTGPTEMTPCLARAEFWRFGSSMSASLSSFLMEHGDQGTALRDQLAVAQATKDHVIAKYFPNLDTAPVMHRFLHALMTSIFMKIKLIITYRLMLARHHGARSIPAAESKEVVDMAFTLLAQVDAMQANPEFHRWTWHMRSGNSVQWHALCIVLSQLCTQQPWTEELDGVFAAIKERMHLIPESARSNPLWSPAAKLMARAQKLHERYRASQATTQQQAVVAAPNPAADFVGVGIMSPPMANWNPPMPGFLNATADYSAMSIALDPGAAAMASSDGLLFGDPVTLADLTDADMGDSTNWEQWDDMIMSMMGGGNASGGMSLGV